jgi:hypothetical protein
VNVTGYIALGLMAAGVAFGWKSYAFDHLSEFRMIQAEVLYEKCMRECREVCGANGIEADVCVCDHCRKYLEVE